MNLFGLRSHEAAVLFPLMGPQELGELTLDVKAHGVRVPVVIWDAGGEWVLLDGRNRVKAAEQAGVPSHKIPHTVYDGKDPIDHVITLNIHRRQLTTSQRALIAAELEQLLMGQTAHRPDGSGPPKEEERARAKAGKALGVGGRSVQRAKKVSAKSAPAVMDAVRSGRITVNDAESIVELDAEEQTSLVREVLDGKSRSIREAAVAAGYIEASPMELQVSRVVKELRGLRLEQLRLLRDEIDALILEQERGAA